MEQGKQQQWQHHVASCQVVEQECEDEWNERRETFQELVMYQ